MTKQGCRDYYAVIGGKDVTRSEKITKLRAYLNSYNEKFGANFPFGYFYRKPWSPERARREVQLLKERFATCISGSRQGISHFIDPRDVVYLVSMWGMCTFLVTVLIRIDIESWDDARNFFTYGRPEFYLLGFSAGTFILWSLFSYQFGRWLAWKMQLIITGGYVHKDCRKIANEKRIWNKRAELEWWIEEILKEQSDSFIRADERRRVIIAPIQEMICETRILECFVGDVQRPEMCKDCRSTHCCLSKSVKLPC
ncbi:hypothetical protein NHQ30_010135 [Ciborinia camelliae]|nr:hypothetical protein NHQ30_010135 [Ciborinia camelliae]